jgi:ComF family protein
MESGDGLPCGRCQRQPPPFAASRVPLLYQPPLSNLIGAFKYRHKLHLAGPLSRLFCEQLPPGLELPDLILPVPLHPRRLRERGFNQSLELARGVAATLGLALQWRCCRRTRATQPQSGLDEAARRKNLRSAFIVDGDLTGRHIALFDDVVTTGATVAAASRALRQAGAARVDVWALARTPDASHRLQ